MSHSTTLGAKSQSPNSASVKRTGDHSRDAKSQRWVHLFQTPLGWFFVQFHETALTRIHFGYSTRQQTLEVFEKQQDASISKVVRTVPAFAEDWIDGLKQFAKGHPVDLRNIPIDTQHLTAFGKSVSQACQNITWGQTASYKQLAEAAGSPAASRAVGAVMANNRFPLVVPCHRIMASNGNLTGFSAPGGVQTKQRLLCRERETPLGF